MSVCTFSANCCRICCATEFDDIQNIFETTAETGERAVDMLEYCLQHPIDTSDCFPKYICVECVSNLIQAYEFFSLYKQSEKYFVSLYRKVNEAYDVSASVNHIEIESIELPEMNEKLIKIEPEMDIITTNDDIIIATNNNQQQQQQISEEENPAHNDGIKIESIELPEIDEMLIKTEPEMEIITTYDDFTITTNNNDNQEPQQSSDEGNRAHNYTNQSLSSEQHQNTQKRSCECLDCKIAFESYVDLCLQMREHSDPTTTSEETERTLGERECHLCNKKFKKREKLDEHLQTHTEDDEKNYKARPHRCKVCFKRYQTTHILTTHMRIHTGERPFKCVCGGRFIDKTILNKHMRNCPAHISVPIEKPSESYEERCAFECKFCNRRFGTNDTLKIHMESHTEEDAKEYNQRRHQCSICLKRFKRTYEFKHHIPVHTREKPYKCKSCGIKYSAPKKLRAHIKQCAPHLIVTKSKGQFRCSHCENTYETAHGMQDHRRRHSLPVHECEYCVQAFEKKIELVKHIEQSHGNELKEFRCDQCSDSFPLRSFLSLHMEKHNASGAVNKCTQCDKVFDYPARLIAHQITHSDERPFACDRCTSTFKAKAELNKHKSTVHDGKRDFYCNICKRYYSSSSALSVHRREKHIGIRLFVCENADCGKSFLTKPALQIHRRKHTGDKPYKCEFCERLFGQKSGMTKHMLLHLGPTPHKCTECGESFRLITELRIHSYSHFKPPAN